ncbi:MAG TPA: hypothetical protein VKY66_06810 [Protaetiibacter sp.]|nr:hypothetical protein [Protaetiibacter sp.]
MVARRVVYRLLFPAAVVLPVVLFIGRGIVVGGGWEAAAFVIVSPVLFLALAVIAGIVFWRPGVRGERAVSVGDAVALPVLWALLVATSFLTHPALASVTVLALLAMFWFAVWEFITESRRRIRAVMDDVDATLSGARASVPQRPQPTHIGEVIVVTSRDVPPDRGDAAP